MALDKPWDPETYPTEIRDEIYHYEDLQHRVAKATSTVAARSILELGIGTGETATRVLALHPDAHLVGIDSSPEMIGAAARRLPQDRVSFIEQDLAAPLPDQTFDVVYSGLAIHHLEGELKKVLFEDVARHLTARGLFVLGDVIVPEDPSDAVIELEPGYDFPSSMREHLEWMETVGLAPEVTWLRKDLAVIEARPKEA